jgi:hypothetical protein
LLVVVVVVVAPALAAAPGDTDQALKDNNRVS